MIVRYLHEGSPFSLLEGKEYPVISIECGWYRIWDESGEDYLYPPRSFEIVEPLPEPPTVEPMPAPDGFRDE